LEKRGVGKETERREKLSVFFEFKLFSNRHKLGKRMMEVSPHVFSGCLKGGGGGVLAGKKKLSSVKTRDPKHDRKSEELDTHAGGGKKIGA